MNHKPGTLYGIGVGPGAPDLLTLRAYNLLQNIPVVAAPISSKHKKSMALAAVQNYLSPDVEILNLHFKMVKDQNERQQYRQKAADEIAARLQQGKDVAFITEGDVMLYSTFAYILELLGSQFQAEIIPGISSVMASAAAAKIPLTINEQRLLVVPATHESPQTLKELLTKHDTIVMLKIYTLIEQITQALQETGRLQDAVVIEKASLENSRLYTDLENLKNGELPYMSQLIVSKNTQEFGEL